MVGVRLYRGENRLNRLIAYLSKFQVSISLLYCNFEQFFLQCLYTLLYTSFRHTYTQSSTVMYYSLRSPRDSALEEATYAQGDQQRSPRDDHKDEFCHRQIYMFMCLNEGRSVCMLVSQ